MPRRPGPPRDYYEEEIYDVERERDPYRPRAHDYESRDVEYRRRKSEPLVDDMERMGFRERPRREFMEESLERPPEREDMVFRRSREEVEMESPERPVPLGREEGYGRPPRSRRRPRAREVDDEDLVFEERESRRGSRRHPRDLEEDLIVDERTRHMERRPRPEREIEQDLFDEEDRPRESRRRPRKRSEEDIIDERERGGERPRRSVPEFEEPEPIERESRRSRRRHRGVEEDDVAFEEREIRRGNKRHPERRSEDDLLVEEKEIRRGSARHPERRSEDDLLHERERRHRRRRPEREPEEDFVEEPRQHGRRRRPEAGIEDEELLIRRREGEGPLRRGWDSERDMRSHERTRGFEEERYRRPRPGPPPARRVEVEEVIPDDVLPDRHRIPIDPSEDDFEEEDVSIRRKGKAPRPIDPREEEIVMRDRRERRRSPPIEEPDREMRGLRRERKMDPSFDEELSVQSQSDSNMRPRNIVVDEEVRIRKTKDMVPPSPPSPPVEPIHAPPITRDVYAHPRDIERGKKLCPYLNKSRELRGLQAMKKFDLLAYLHQNCGRLEAVPIRLTYPLGKCTVLNGCTPCLHIY